MIEDITRWKSFDVETVGDEPCYALQPCRREHHEASIRTYAITEIRDGKLSSHSTDEIVRDRIATFLTYCADNNHRIVVWKGWFDVAWLCSYGLIEEAFRCKWLDAMILWKNLDRTRRTWKLKECVALNYPKYAGYGEDIDFEGPVEPLLKYNEMDTEFTLLLAVQLWKCFTDREKRALLIDMEDIPAIAERNYKGIYVDLTATKDVLHFLSQQRSENLEKLKPYLPPDFNLDSNQQVAKLLFEDWGLPVYKTTDKGSPSTDKESLLETSHLDERAKWVQQYRETTGLRSKCVKAVMESVMYNRPPGNFIFEHIVRPEQNKAGTYTDRCTYSSFQNGPAKKKSK